MWKAPYRPRQSEISQNFNDGLLDIYTVTDGAFPGYQPKDVLTKKGTLPFEEQRVGLQRYYNAKQDQIEVEKVLRVPRGFPVNSQDVAIIRGTDTQYHIDLVQKVDDVYPPCWDLTLSKITQGLPVSGEGGKDDDLV